LTVGEAADRVYMRPSPELIREVTGVDGGNVSSLLKYAASGIDPLHWDEAASEEDFYAVHVALDDDPALDPFPGTWKALAYVVSDPVRMRSASRLRDQFLEIVGGRALFAGVPKQDVDFYEYSDSLPAPFGSENPQMEYYAYLSTDSAFTDELLRAFGLWNRCWHGQGYVGLNDRVLARVFLVRNLPITDDRVLSCRLLSRGDVLVDP
jgi:hypothetical protein